MNRQTVSPAAIEQWEVTVLLKGHLITMRTITVPGPRPYTLVLMPASVGLSVWSGVWKTISGPQTAF